MKYPPGGWILAGILQLCGRLSTATQRTISNHAWHIRKHRRKRIRRFGQHVGVSFLSVSARDCKTCWNLDIAVLKWQHYRRVGIVGQLLPIEHIAAFSRSGN